MTQLSDHLTLEEFIHSDTAIANNIDNTLPDNLMQNAIDVATNVFEPVRELLGVPIKLDSGYRNAEVNVLVRGVPTSQHTEGKAIDMVPEGISIADAFEKIKASNIVWDQLIAEHTSSGVYWIHASYNKDNNRQQVIPNLLKLNN